MPQEAQASRTRLILAAGPSTRRLRLLRVAGLRSIPGNNVYFTGTTNFLYAGCSGCATTDFPILNAYQPCLDQAPPATIVNPPTCTTSTATTASDAFVAKLNLNTNVPQGQQLEWSTFVGGTGDDAGNGVAVDSGAANVYLVGTTDSTDIGAGLTSLSTSAAYQRCLDTPVNPAVGTTCTPPGTLANDAFVARLSNPATSTTTTTTVVTLNYFSYLGGTKDEDGLAITVDSGSGALVTGWTQSSDFPVLPTSNSIQSNNAGGQDAFVARLNTTAVVGQTTTASWASYFGGSGTDSGTGIVLDPNQNTYLAGETNSPPATFQVAKPLTSADGGGYQGGYDAFVTQLGTAVSLSIQGVLTQGSSQTFYQRRTSCDLHLHGDQQRTGSGQQYHGPGEPEFHDHGSAADQHYGERDLRYLRCCLNQFDRELQLAIAPVRFDRDGYHHRYTYRQ